MRFISLIFLFFYSSFTFAAYYVDDPDELVRLESFSGSYNSNPAPYCGLSVGDVFNPKVCLGTTFLRNGQTLTVSSVRFYCSSNTACSYRASNGSYYYIVGSVTRYVSCPAGTELNTSTNRCEAPISRCEQVMESAPTVEVWWDESSFGNNMVGSYWCTSSSQCTAQLDNFVGCDSASGRCFADASLTGSECDAGVTNGFCTDSSCSESLPAGGGNPEPEPEPEPEPDPTPDPDLPPIEGGGDVSNPDVDPTEPLPVDPPETVPESSDAAQAVTNMNGDVNQALNNLNLDINQSNANIENQLKLLNSSNEGIRAQVAQLENTNANIANNIRQAVISASANVVDSVNANTSAVNAVGDSVDGLAEDVTGIRDDLGELGETVAGIGEHIEGIADVADGFANVDVSNALDTNCISNNGEYTFCNGFYESQYPEGFQGVFDNHFERMSNIVTDSVSNIFGSLDLSSASAPSFCIQLWMMGSYCFTDYIDLDWIFGFIRFCMMFSTVWLCRRLVFGG